jgi:hypothetical protein
VKQTVLGLALLATSAAVGRDVLPAPGTHQEPLARALEPLGPVKALISSALWMGVQAGQRSGDASRVVDLSHALLDLQPDLDEVRRFLAGQLVVTEAPRAADRVRHDALVRAGLTLLEEGLERRDSSALRVELAETIVVQRFMDPAFEPVAAQHFGAPPLDVAIELYAGAERTEGVPTTAGRRGATWRRQKRCWSPCARRRRGPISTRSSSRCARHWAEAPPGRTTTRDDRTALHRHDRDRRAAARAELRAARRAAR